MLAVPCEKLDRRLQENRGGVNVDFFKGWSHEMAYVLGYFAADGCLAVNPLGARYIHFDSIDRDQLEMVKTLLESKHALSPKPKSKNSWETCYRLQIGSRRMFFDLVELGFGLKKGSRIQLPKMPQPFVPDFVRGFFDGDGGVSYGTYRRKNRPGKTRALLARFTSESKEFLRDLREILTREGGIGKGSLIFYGTYACLSYTHHDCLRLFRFMYGDNGYPKKLFLKRKYAKFLKGLQFVLKGP